MNDRPLLARRGAKRGGGSIVSIAVMAALLFVAPRAQESPILAAMQDEIQRSMAELRMKGEAAPYFIAYDLVDRTIFDIAGRHGAIVENEPRRSRMLRVEVRVGDYAFDNSRFVVQGFGSAMMGDVVLAPLDDNYDALRRELWITTDAAYKRAITMFARKKASFQNRAASDPVPDFSREPAVETILSATARTNSAHRRDLAAALRQASAVFAAFPEIDSSEIAVNHVHGMRYYLNSEGTRTVAPLELAALSMYAEAQAEDGMPVRRTFSTVERALTDVPAAAQLTERARELAAEVVALRTAPVGEEFSGAVLLEGAAGPQFIAETLVPMVQARRPPDYENPRMAQGEPSPFLNRTGLRVMADAFTVRDTPSMAAFEGRPLAGSYVVDDEGVRARDVVMVEKGRLATLLTSRVPQKNFTRSNGHGRSGTVVAGVVDVESGQAIPASELKAKYLALIKAQERTFGYIVRGVRGDGPGSAGPGIDAIVKVTLDGGESPVRGLRFAQVPPMAFRDIAEASRERSVFSYRATTTAAVSVVAPSLIFEELDIQRIRDILQKPPVVPSPMSSLQ